MDKNPSSSSSPLKGGGSPRTALRWPEAALLKHEAGPIQASRSQAKRQVERAQQQAPTRGRQARLGGRASRAQEASASCEREETVRQLVDEVVSGSSTSRVMVLIPQTKGISSGGGVSSAIARGESLARRLDREANRLAAEAIAREDAAATRARLALEAKTEKAAEPQVGVEAVEAAEGSGLDMGAPWLPEDLARIRQELFAAQRT
jgi:hypothetical protein